VCKKEDKYTKLEQEIFSPEEIQFRQMRSQIVEYKNKMRYLKDSIEEKKSSLADLADEIFSLKSRIHDRTTEESLEEILITLRTISVAMTLNLDLAMNPNDRERVVKYLNRKLVREISIDEELLEKSESLGKEGLILKEELGKDKRQLQELEDTYEELNKRWDSMWNALDEKTFRAHSEEFEAAVKKVSNEE
jgi:hypothetical protein